MLDSRLDYLKSAPDNYPTYIKMDIESAEPEALWGASQILQIILLFSPCVPIISQSIFGPYLF